MQSDPPAPEPPPEAVILRIAREATGMTAGDAAAATEGTVSATYWRDVERGYGGRRGKRVPARASSRYLAHMARVVGLTPDQLTDAGRDDAARVLGEILRREQVPASPDPPPAPHRLPHLYDPALDPYLPGVRDELAKAMREYGPTFTGDEAFPDNDLEADAWDSPLLTPDESMRQIAWLRLRRDRRRESRRETGLWRA